PTMNPRTRCIWIPAFLFLTGSAFGQSPSPAYAATSHGVYKSIDGGTNWQEMSAWLGAREVLSLAIDPSDSASLFAGADGGIWVSHDAARAGLRFRFRRVLSQSRSIHSIASSKRGERYRSCFLFLAAYRTPLNPWDTRSPL